MGGSMPLMRPYGTLMGPIPMQPMGMYTGMHPMGHPPPPPGGMYGHAHPMQMGMMPAACYGFSAQQMQEGAAMMAMGPGGPYPMYGAYPGMQQMAGYAPAAFGHPLAGRMHSMPAPMTVSSEGHHQSGHGYDRSHGHGSHSQRSSYAGYGKTGQHESSSSSQGAGQSQQEASKGSSSSGPAGSSSGPESGTQQ